jgi:NADH-quinone oxidoreductase subunit G
MDDCSECGECMSVCPVGALIDSDFKYHSNSWELQKIPAANPHYSDGSLIYYEVKQESCENSNKSIYRVTNNFEFDSIPGSIRFGFDFENRSQKSENRFDNAIEAFKKADAIRFNSYITNEEAYILQQLKEQFGVKLINKDAKPFAEFLTAYSKISGKMLYSANKEDVESSDFTIIIGSKLTTDNPYLKNKVNISSKRNRADIIYMHPIEDALLSTIANHQIKYEVGTEEGVLAVLASHLLEEVELDSSTKSYLDKFDLGYLLSETNISDDDIATITKLALKNNNKTLIIGADAISNKRGANIARLCALIEKYAGFKVMIIPTSTNTLGVSLICDLDDEHTNSNEFIIGYNEKGNFVLSNHGNGDLDMPSLNQQEGTFTSMNKTVVPTNVAINFDGYCLNDIACRLDISTTNSIDYTKLLPKSKGYAGIEFDDLENSFGYTGEEKRGYTLQNIEVTTEFSLEDIEELPEFNGSVIYECEPIMQVNYNTYKSKKLKDEAVLKGSNQFSIAAKIEDNDIVEIDFGNFTIRRKFVIDKFLKGTIAINPTFDFDLENRHLLSGYRYKQVQIKKVIG